MDDEQEPAGVGAPIEVDGAEQRPALEVELRLGGARGRLDARRVILRRDLS